MILGRFPGNLSCHENFVKHFLDAIFPQSTMYDFKKYNKKDRSSFLQIWNSYNPFNLSHNRLQIFFFISIVIAMSIGNRRYIHFIKQNLEKTYKMYEA